MIRWTAAMAAVLAAACAAGRTSRTVTTLEDNDRRIVHVQYVPDGNGGERLMMKLVLTRVAATADK